MTDKEKEVYKQAIDPKHKRDLLGVDAVSYTHLTF